MEKKMKLEEKLVDYLEALAFETDARRNLIETILERDAVLQSEGFQTYHDQYREFFTKYELAKQKLEEDYVLPITKRKNSRWSLDFRTKELTILWEE